MIFKYITHNDILAAIRQDLLVNFAQNQQELDNFISVCENIAIESVISKLNNRYDISKIFFIISIYDSSSQYENNDVVYYNDNFYIAIAPNTGIAPSNNLYWIQKDPRHPIIVSIVSDITIFLLHKRINPRKIPELRINAYNEAIEWLDSCRDNKENPILPIKISGTQNISWGSNPLNEHYY